MSFDLGLSEEQEALRQLAHEFARDVMRPAAPHYDKSGEYPWDCIKQAHALGIMNTHIPGAQGGMELGALDGLLIAEELAWAARASARPSRPTAWRSSR